MINSVTRPGKKPKVWTPQMKELIERLTKEGPATAPFELRRGSLVTDPAKFHAALLLEIEGGPAGARAMLGGLEGDLRDFFARRQAPAIKGKVSE